MEINDIFRFFFSIIKFILKIIEKILDYVVEILLIVGSAFAIYLSYKKYNKWRNYDREV